MPLTFAAHALCALCPQVYQRQLMKQALSKGIVDAGGLTPQFSGEELRALFRVGLGAGRKGCACMLWVPL